mgnify:CR=1 FL=1
MARLPYLKRSDLLSSEQHYYDEISEKRDFFPRPFSVLLNNPKAAVKVANLGSYVRFESSLPHQIREIVILTVAREMNNAYEFTHHSSIAQNFGVTSNIIEAIKNNITETLPEKEKLFIAFTKNVMTSDKIPDIIYNRIKKLIGDQGVIDLTVTITYYCLLARIMDVFEVTLEPNQESQLDI